MTRDKFLNYVAVATLVLLNIATCSVIYTCLRIHSRGGLLYSVEHSNVNIDNVERWIGCKP